MIEVTEKPAIGKSGTKAQSTEQIQLPGINKEKEPQRNCRDLLKEEPAQQLFRDLGGACLLDPERENQILEELRANKGQMINLLLTLPSSLAALEQLVLKESRGHEMEKTKSCIARDLQKESKRLNTTAEAVAEAGRDKACFFTAVEPDLRLVSTALKFLKTDCQVSDDSILCALLNAQRTQREVLVHPLTTITSRLQLTTAETLETLLNSKSDPLGSLAQRSEKTALAGDKDFAEVIAGIRRSALASVDVLCLDCNDYSQKWDALLKFEKINVALSHEIIRSHINQVMKHGRRFHLNKREGIFSFSDYVQEGLIATMMSLGAYKPNHGTKPSTFIHRPIRWKMLAAAADADLGIAHHKGSRASVAALSRADDEIRMQNGRAATDKELAKYLGKPLKEVQETRKLLSKRLDVYETHASFQLFNTERSPSSLSLLSELSRDQLLHRAVKTVLDPEQSSIIRNCYGILADGDFLEREAPTRKEIADRLGISGELARRYEGRGFSKIINFMYLAALGENERDLLFLRFLSAPEKKLMENVFSSALPDLRGLQAQLRKEFSYNPPEPKSKRSDADLPIYSWVANCMTRLALYHRFLSYPKKERTEALVSLKDEISAVLIDTATRDEPALPRHRLIPALSLQLTPKEMGAFNGKWADQNICRLEISGLREALRELEKRHGILNKLRPGDHKETETIPEMELSEIF